MNAKISEKENMFFFLNTDVQIKHKSLFCLNKQLHFFIYYIISYPVYAVKNHFKE